MIKEDGTGLATANSYASIEDADAYFTARDNTAWAGATDAEKSVALIRSTDFIDANYIFRSVPLNDDQALENPRFGQLTVSPKVVKATLEMAVIALSTDLFAPITERDVVATDTKVGSIETSKTYSNDKITDAFPHVTKILARIASRRGASASVVGLTR